MHYYNFHIGDYRSSTAHLSNEEDLAYRRLLDMYYDTEKPIPTDLVWVGRRLRVAPVDIQSVLLDFFTETPDGWFNETADRNIKSYQSFLNKQTENGRKGGRPKSIGKPTDNPLVSQQEPKESLTNNHKPITNNQEPVVSKKATSVACPPTVNQQVWSDWLQIRKAKKLPMTETAWSQIQNEFRKCNLSDQQGVEYCCLSNWASFKTAWYEKNLQEQNNGLTKQGQTNQRVLSGLTRGLIQGDSNVRLLGK